MIDLMYFTLISPRTCVHTGAPMGTPCPPKVRPDHGVSFVSRFFFSAGSMMTTPAYAVKLGGRSMRSQQTICLLVLFAAVAAEASESCGIGRIFHAERYTQPSAAEITPRIQGTLAILEIFGSPETIAMLGCSSDDLERLAGAASADIGGRIAAWRAAQRAWGDAQASASDDESLQRQDLQDAARASKVAVFEMLVESQGYGWELDAKVWFDRVQSDPILLQLPPELAFSSADTQTLSRIAKIIGRDANMLPVDSRSGDSTRLNDVWSEQDVARLRDKRIANGAETELALQLLLR